MRRFALALGLFLAGTAPLVHAETPAPAAAPAPSPAAARPDDTAKKSSKKPALVDLNTAGADDLKKLPGVDDTAARKIIDGRPYARKDELTKKKILGADQYGKLKDQVIAHHVKAATPAPSK